MRKFKLVGDAQQFQGTHTAVSANQLSGSQAYQDRWLPKKARNLGQANLGQANLGQANLGQANLGQANLGQANLGQANLGQGRAAAAML